VCVWFVAGCLCCVVFCVVLCVWLLVGCLCVWFVCVMVCVVGWLFVECLCVVGAAVCFNMHVCVFVVAGGRDCSVGRMCVCCVVCAMIVNDVTNA
jgi:hypothetical protein